MRTRQKIPFYIANTIAHISGISNDWIEMFDIKTNRLFWTVSVHFTALWLVVTNKRPSQEGMRGNTVYRKTEYLYEFDDKYKASQSYENYMNQYNLSI